MSTPTTAAVDPDPSPPPPPPLTIPAVDLRLLSQSDLLSLSKCSNSSHDLHDVVFPKIHRSVFNESAGSRKQTYSRLRLAPPDSSKTSTIHRRLPRIRASHTFAASTLVAVPDNDPEHAAENSQIITALKELFSLHSTFQEDLPSVSAVNAVAVAPPSLQTLAPEELETLAPDELEAKAPELLETTASESLEATEPEALEAAPSEALETEVPEALETVVPEPLETVAPETLEAKVPEPLETESAEQLDTAVTEASKLLDTGGPELPKLLDTGVYESSKPEMKRKRGRPRKGESLVSDRPPAAKRTRNSMVKKVVVYDDDKDREILNSRGVEVNLRNLGMLEDPYGAEIRRRTEGLSTSDELLGFLRGLNGQWGTTRKKRRVVYASDFGDALPNGWKLSLCIKRKEGHFWIYCRRYISPSGRQFESCKEISVYLLSILGEESMDKSPQPHSNNRDDSALKESSVNAANILAQEDLERNITVHNPSTPPISLPTDCEKQITYGIVAPPDVHVDDVYKCLKCFLIFEGKSELWDHKSLSHKDDECQLGSSSLPDWSIVIGGIFTCNTCHQTFFEISQYNEHVGTHATNENKTAEKSVDSVSVSAETDHKMSFDTESNKIDEVVHDLDMNEDVLVEESGDGIGSKCVNDNNVPETNRAPDVSIFVSVSKPECEINRDMVGRSNDQDSGSETRVQTSSICEEKGLEANINDARIYCSFDKLTTEKGKVVYKESSSGLLNGVSNGQDAVSETRVHTSSICEEKIYQENISDMHVSSSFEEFTSEKGKVVNNESSPGVFHGITYGQDAVSEARVQPKGFQENINDTHVFSQFGVLTSEKGEVDNKDASSGVFHNHRGSGEARLTETKKVSESENLSLFSNTLKIAADNSSLLSSKKQDSFQKLGFASADQVSQGFNENRFSYNISSSKPDEPYEVRNREFDRYVGKEHVNKEYFQIKNVDKSGEANLDEFQVFRNNQSINNEVASLGSSSQNGLNANVMDFNTGKSIEFSSLVPSGNNQAFSFQDGLKFDDIFGDKFDENIHELSLAFGNPNSLYEDTVSVNEQKKDGLSCSSMVTPKINDTFDVQTDLSMVNNSMVQDLKRGNGTRGFQNNDNSVYPGRTWSDFKSDEFRNTEGKKFMMGSGSNQMWKTAPQENHLQSGLVNSHAQIQSPNFHSFDIMSQKAQDGLYRHTERYNPSRSEPVEFRFLTDRSEHNPHALQSGSREFPYVYNTGIEQGFDSNLWMGKNASMMPNMSGSGRNVITSSICTWCRNEFHLPAMVLHQQMQAGVGSLCPNCSAGISGQVNML